MARSRSRAGESITSVWPKARYSLKGIAMDYTPGPQALAYRWSVVSGTSAAAGHRFQRGV